MKMSSSGGRRFAQKGVPRQNWEKCSNFILAGFLELNNYPTKIFIVISWNSY
jgi:hypothetical protein